MSTPTTWPSAKAVLGLAVETTQGTPNTTVAMTMPVDSFEPEDKPVWLQDNAMRAAMTENYAQIQGPMYTEFSGGGPLFFNVLPYLLRNIFGALATTGPVSSAYTHTASLLNSGTGQPDSLTFVQWQGPTATSFSRMYAGCCLSELTIKGNPESSLVEVSFKGMGFPSADFPTAPPTFPANTDSPLAAWRTAIGIGGTAVGAPVRTVREWEVTFSRECKAIWTAQNSQSPYIIQRGKLTAATNLNFAAPSDETPLDYLLNNTQPQTQIVVSNAAAAAALRSLTIDMQQNAFDTSKIDFSEEAVSYKGSTKPVANTTNIGASGGYGPATVSVVNATVSY